VLLALSDEAAVDEAGAGGNSWWNRINCHCQYCQFCLQPPPNNFCPRPPFTFTICFVLTLNSNSLHYLLLVTAFQQEASTLFRCIRAVFLLVSILATALSKPHLQQRLSKPPRQHVGSRVSIQLLCISLDTAGGSRAPAGVLALQQTLHSSIVLSLSCADFSARLAGINVGAAHDEPSGDFGLIGLAVMGQNLILNAADHGFTVVAFNRTVSKVDRFLENEAKGKKPRKRPRVKDIKYSRLTSPQASPSSVLTPSRSSVPSSSVLVV
jgi:hypothetical protein